MNIYEKKCIYSIQVDGKEIRLILNYHYFMIVVLVHSCTTLQQQKQNMCDSTSVPLSVVIVIASVDPELCRRMSFPSMLP